MTPEEFLDSVDEPRRSDMRKLHELIRATAPGLEPVMLGKMLGYGPFHYRYESGREGDAAVIALANNARDIAVHVLCADDDGYLAEQYKARFPKANVGKSCLRIRKLDDVDLDALRELVAKAAQMGGVAAV